MIRAIITFIGKDDNITYECEIELPFPDKDALTSYGFDKAKSDISALYERMHPSTFSKVYLLELDFVD